MQENSPLNGAPSTEVKEGLAALIGETAARGRTLSELVSKACQDLDNFHELKISEETEGPVENNYNPVKAMETKMLGHRQKVYRIRDYYSS